MTCHVVDRRGQSCSVADRGRTGNILTQEKRFVTQPHHPPRTEPARAVACSGEVPTCLENISSTFCRCSFWSSVLSVLVGGDGERSHSLGRDHRVRDQEQRLPGHHHARTAGEIAIFVHGGLTVRTRTRAVLFLSGRTSNPSVLQKPTRPSGRCSRSFS